MNLVERVKDAAVWYYNANQDMAYRLEFGLWVVYYAIEWPVVALYEKIRGENYGRK